MATHVDPLTKARLFERANEEMTSVSSVLRRAVAAHLEREDDDDEEAAGANSSVPRSTSRARARGEGARRRRSVRGLPACVAGDTRPPRDPGDRRGRDRAHPSQSDQARRQRLLALLRGRARRTRRGFHQRIRVVSGRLLLLSEPGLGSEHIATIYTYSAEDVLIHPPGGVR